MKKLLLLLLLFTGMVNAQIVNIPDTVIKTWLLAASTTDTNFQMAKDFSDNWVVIDTNTDGEIQVSEAQAIKYLLVRGSINNPSLTNNISGLESFSNIKSLYLDYINTPTLDLNALTSLTTLNVFNCFPQTTTLNINSLVNLEDLTIINSSITNTLQINNLTNLKTIAIVSTLITNINMNATSSLTEVFCLSNNQLSSLNFTGYSNLTKITCASNALSSLTLIGVNNLLELVCSRNQLTSLNGISPTITKLNCSNNLLTNFDPNPLTNLTELNCSGNRIPSLDVSNLSNLTRLDCSANLISTLSISNMPNLVSLNCSENQNLTTASFSNLPTLVDLFVTGTINSNNVILSQLSSLTLANLPNLKRLNCSNGLLTSLNLTGLNNLEELDCTWNQITNLNLTNMPNLKKLNCPYNQITNLDVSGLSNLTDLNCGKGYTVGQQIIPTLQSLNVAGLSNLVHLDCSINLLTNLNLSGLISLQTLYCNGWPGVYNNITTLNVNSLANLKNLNCSYMQLTSLDVSNLVNLTDLNCSYNTISNLNLTGLITLKNLDYSYNLLSNLSLINLPSLEFLNCGFNQLVTLNVLNLGNLKSLFCSNNQLTTLNLAGLTNLESLDFSSNQLTLSNVSGLSSILKVLSCSNNNLTSLNVNGLTSLESLSCGRNQLTSLDSSTLLNLKNLDCSENQITSLSVANSPNLEILNCSINAINNLSLNNLNNLKILYCANNQLSNLDLTNNTLLNNLDYSNNTLPNLNINFLTNLLVLDCSDSQSTLLDVSNLLGLQSLDCENNQIQSLDLNNNQSLNNLNCQNNALTSLFIKNGKNENINFNNNPSLQYICADDDQLVSIQSQLNSMGMSTTVSNSYCTFLPGGNRNTITGLTIYDDDNNGCDITDEVNPYIRLNISDNATQGATVTNIAGSYTFYTNAGNYTIEPNIENPAWFVFSPPSAAFSFTNNNNNINSQNFCINAVGNHPDIEIVYHQTVVARPGFDSGYKIVFKNKGNQMQSGTLTLAYDDARTDFLTSTPVADVNAAGLLTWNYQNLMPFESRSIELTFNTNSPQEVPAVNNGDILPFTVTINPIGGDELPNDNTFQYNQLVVGSYDPNEIICLEGDSVPPSEIGNYLHYVINFENLGTFFAENVVVRSEIDATKYDIGTLQVMSTSHPSYTKISGNVVEFIFENINLAEASGNPPVGGHGDVLFKIKTKDNLVIDDTVLQRAGIYFDYNFPIVTNDAETTFAALNNPDFELDNSVKVYPNPTNSIINITSDFTIESIELYDIQGRILSTSIENRNQTALDISSKSKGIYFLKIKTDNGYKVEKIVKK